MKRLTGLAFAAALHSVFLPACGLRTTLADQDLSREFLKPRDAARPWVYLMFMDGNLTREGMTADLEAMKQAGIGGAIIFEVNVGMPRGPVAVMARVKLNGRDCGIVWTQPYRVDITAALQPGGNALEIEVANLWPNRLIGDSALPAEKRFTFTTWSPYTRNSPLLPSGLLGPVTLQSADWK